MRIAHDFVEHHTLTGEPYGEATLTFGAPGFYGYYAYILREAYCQPIAGSSGGAVMTFSWATYSVTASPGGVLADWISTDMLPPEDYSCTMHVWGANGGGGYAYIAAYY